MCNICSHSCWMDVAGAVSSKVHSCCWSIRLCPWLVHPRSSLFGASSPVTEKPYTRVTVTEMHRWVDSSPPTSLICIPHPSNFLPLLLFVVSRRLSVLYCQRRESLRSWCQYRGPSSVSLTHLCSTGLGTSLFIFVIYS